MRKLVAFKDTNHKLKCIYLTSRYVGHVTSPKGYVRSVVQEHCVIESLPDNAHDDLRLDETFEELRDFVDSIDIDKLDKKDHSHTPYVIILYKYLQLWK